MASTKFVSKGIQIHFEFTKNLLKNISVCNLGSKPILNFFFEKISCGSFWVKLQFQSFA